MSIITKLFFFQADEIARMRSSQHEQSSRLSHLQLTIDEKDHDLKTLQGNLVRLTPMRFNTLLKLITMIYYYDNAYMFT